MRINNHELFVQVRGPQNGLPVVFLHHGLGSARAWRRQTGALAAAGLRVIVYDRWGYGKSSARFTLGIPEFLDDRADLLQLLDILNTQKAVLVGHSDGGTIALYFAAQHPERVLALVTIAAHIYIEPKMGAGIEGIRCAYEQDAEFREKFIEVHGEKWQQVFNNWYNGWLQSTNLGWDMRPVLGKICCPTLVIQGLEDEHASDDHAKKLAAEIPGASLWLVPQIGHMLQRQIPVELNRRLLTFITTSVNNAQSMVSG